MEVMPDEVWVADVSRDSKDEILEIVSETYGGVKYIRADIDRLKQQQPERE